MAMKKGEKSCFKVIVETTHRAKTIETIREASTFLKVQEESNASKEKNAIPNPDGKLNYTRTFNHTHVVDLLHYGQKVVLRG